MNFAFVFFIFCVRRVIDVLDPENQPGAGSSGPDPNPGLTEDLWHQKYENKNEDLQNYLEYSFCSILNIFYCSGCRALDPEFGQNRIHITGGNALRRYLLSLEIMPFWFLFFVPISNMYIIDI